MLFRGYLSSSVIVLVIRPSKKRGYIGVTVSGCRSEAIFCPAYFLQTTVEFNTILHEASLPKGDVRIVKG